MKKFQKFIIILLLFQSLFIPQLKAHACKAFIYNWRATHSKINRFPVEIVALGSVYSIATGEYTLTDVIRDIPKLKSWGEITKFQENTIFNQQELQNHLLSQNSFNPLFSQAFLISSNENNSLNNEKNVLLFKPSLSKSNIFMDDKTFLIENQDIKNNALHLHYIKIPEGLLKSNQKLVAETTLIYSNPNKKETLDFNLSNYSRIRQIEGKILKNHDKKLVLKKENNNICSIQKEFKINPSSKPLILTVYNPYQKPVKKGTEKIQYSCGKYVVLVKFKTLSN